MPESHLVPWARNLRRQFGGIDGVCDAILAACGGEAPHRPNADAPVHLSRLARGEG